MIHVSESPPCSNNQLRYVFQELQIPQCIVSLKVSEERVHLILYLNFLFLSKPYGFVVLRIPSPEMAQLPNHLLQLLLLLLLTAIGTLRRNHVLVGVAQVAPRLS